MNATLTNAAGTDLIILIQPDGSRLLREITTPKFRRDWDKAMSEFGAENSEAVKTAVALVYLSHGTPTWYSGSEIREVCGLEG